MKKTILHGILSLLCLIISSDSHGYTLNGMKTGPTLYLYSTHPQYDPVMMEAAKVWKTSGANINFVNSYGSAYTGSVSLYVFDWIGFMGSDNDDCKGITSSGEGPLAIITGGTGWGGKPQIMVELCQFRFCSPGNSNTVPGYSAEELSIQFGTVIPYSVCSVPWTTSVPGSGQYDMVGHLVMDIGKALGLGDGNVCPGNVMCPFKAGDASHRVLGCDDIQGVQSIYGGSMPGMCLGGGSCKPQCSGKQCGSDGCGGACGVCAVSKVCSNFTCQTQIVDTDKDGVPDNKDNCPTVPNGPSQANMADYGNMNQSDMDADGKGDLCDDDVDGDGILNPGDNCVWVKNPDQKDIDGDKLGDACDTDNDNDGIPNAQDNCPAVKNPDQKDSDKNGIGDACDAAINPDMDGDGLSNEEEKQLGTNPKKQDTDDDGLNDWDEVNKYETNPTKADTDGDKVLDKPDNCKLTSNPDQKDSNGDGVGDVCEEENKKKCGKVGPNCEKYYEMKKMAIGTVWQGCLLKSGDGIDPTTFMVGPKKEVAWNCNVGSPCFCVLPPLAIACDAEKAAAKELCPWNKEKSDIDLKLDPYVNECEELKKLQQETDIFDEPDQEAIQAVQEKLQDKAYSIRVFAFTVKAPQALDQSYSPIYPFVSYLLSKGLAEGIGKNAPDFKVAVKASTGVAQALLMSARPCTEAEIAEDKTSGEDFFAQFVEPHMYFPIQICWNDQYFKGPEPTKLISPDQAKETGIHEGLHAFSYDLFSRLHAKPSKARGEIDHWAIQSIKFAIPEVEISSAPDPNDPIAQYFVRKYDVDYCPK